MFRSGLFSFVSSLLCSCSFFFFFNDTATTEIYTLSLHDALPIFIVLTSERPSAPAASTARATSAWDRSEEHTSELQSRSDLVCRLLLEKKKKTHKTTDYDRAAYVGNDSTQPRHTYQRTHTARNVC